MRIMVTGGGTGGHTSPAVAIVEELQERDARLVIQWVGRENGVEERVCQNYAIPFRSVPVEGWPRTRSLRRLWVAGKLLCGVCKSWMLLRKFRPQLVLGVGGYVSLPLVLTAQRMGIPTVLHEQNKRLGLANRLLAPRCSKILLSYPDTVGNYPKARADVVGNPVRAGFAHPPDRIEACAKLELDPGIPVVLVCGGSQGAHTLNAAMMEAVPGFGTEEVQFLWMTGQADAVAAREVAEAAPAKVHVFSFIDDMVTACAAADLVVSRSGASTTAELAVLGKPAILVPYPHATDNHQEQNARAFETAGAAIVLLDEACTAERLGDLIREVIADGRTADLADAAGKLAKPHAAETIVEAILALAFEEKQG